MRRKDFLEHQVQSLKGLVERWHATGGQDKALEARVRQVVSMDVLSVFGPEATVRALGELDSTEADRLQDMIDHCSQTFYRTDATWNAFALPVAVQWHMKPHRIFIAKRAQPFYMKELALGIQQSVGADNVVLDSAIYSANVLHELSAHALHDHLQVMVNGAPRFTSAPKSMALRSSSEPPWRMVYLLGVEITKPGGKRQLHDPGVQDALHSYLHLGADALIKPVPEATATGVASAESKFDQGAFGNTICHAPRYLFDAIQFGERALRGYRLRQMVEEMAKWEERLTLYHAFNPGPFAIELLLKGKWLSYEMRWSLFVAENVEDAVSDIHAAIDIAKAPFQIRVSPLDLESLRVKRDRTSLTQCQFGVK